MKILKTIDDRQIRHAVRGELSANLFPSHSPTLDPSILTSYPTRDNTKFFSPYGRGIIEDLKSDLETLDRLDT